MYINYMIDIAKILKKDLGEWFGIKGYQGIFQITNKGMIGKNEKGTYNGDYLLAQILRGDAKISNKDYGLKENKTYYILNPSEKCGYEICIYNGQPYLDLFFKRGILFETENEVKQKIKELGW